jgi:hypothetical protein
MGKMEASLARLSALKTFLGFSGTANDGELKRALQSASGVVRAFCGRDLHRATRTVRLHLPASARSFLLHETPVWNVSEVTFVRDDGDEVPLSFTYDSRGIVRFTEAPDLSGGVVRVTYDAGFATTGWDTDGVGFAVPEDLEQSVIYLAGVIAMSGGAVGDLRIGVSQRTDARAGAVTYENSLPVWVRGALNRYRALRL